MWPSELFLCTRKCSTGSLSLDSFISKNIQNAGWRLHLYFFLKEMLRKNYLSRLSDFNTWKSSLVRNGLFYLMDFIASQLLVRFTSTVHRFIFLKLQMSWLNFIIFVTNPLLLVRYRCRWDWMISRCWMSALVYNIAQHHASWAIAWEIDLISRLGLLLCCFWKLKLNSGFTIMVIDCYEELPRKVPPPCLHFNSLSNLTIFLTY